MGGRLCVIASSTTPPPAACHVPDARLRRAADLVTRRPVSAEPGSVMTPDSFEGIAGAFAAQFVGVDIEARAKRCSPRACLRALHSPLYLSPHPDPSS